MTSLLSSNVVKYGGRSGTAVLGIGGSVMFSDLCTYR